MEDANRIVAHLIGERFSKITDYLLTDRHDRVPLCQQQDILYHSKFETSILLNAYDDRIFNFHRVKMQRIEERSAQKKDRHPR